MSGKRSRLLRKALNKNDGIDNIDEKFKGKHTNKYYASKKKGSNAINIVHPSSIRARYKTLKKVVKEGAVSLSALRETIKYRGKK